MVRKQFSTKNTRMSKRQARKAIRSKGMSYPNTPENRAAISGAIDDFLLTLRTRDPKTGRVKVTRKGKRAIKRSQKRR